MNNNTGNYSEEISIKLNKLHWITGTLESEYLKIRDNSEASKEFVATLDEFALKLSSILTETTIRITDSWPIKAANVPLETSPLYFTMIITMGCIGEHARMVEADK